jgi:hypothetical protein
MQDAFIHFVEDAWHLKDWLVLAELARCARCCQGADVLAFVDIDSQQKRVCGYANQGAALGPTKIQGKTLLGAGA